MSGKYVAVQAGRSVTDLPVRQTYYWPKDDGQPATDGPSMLMASYDDGTNIGFWDGLRPQRRQAWAQGREVPNLADPFVSGDCKQQPNLEWCTYQAPRWMVAEVARQLAVIHGLSYTPEVRNAAFRDWGDDPFGGTPCGASALPFRLPLGRRPERLGSPTAFVAIDALRAREINFADPLEPCRVCFERGVVAIERGGHDAAGRHAAMQRREYALAGNRIEAGRGVAARDPSVAAELRSRRAPHASTARIGRSNCAAQHRSDMPGLGERLFPGVGIGVEARGLPCVGVKARDRRAGREPRRIPPAVGARLDHSAIELKIRSCTSPVA